MTPHAATGCAIRRGHERLAAHQAKEPAAQQLHVEQAVEVVKRMTVKELQDFFREMYGPNAKVNNNSQWLRKTALEVAAAEAKHHAQQLTSQSKRGGAKRKIE